MLNNVILAGALMAVAAAPFAAAQAPADKAAVPSQAAVTVKPTVTLAGCLYREEQVAGRTPNIAERAGILEDYILADATIANPQGKPSSGAATGTSGLIPATGSTYKVENLPDDRLKAVLGKRVESLGASSPKAAIVWVSAAVRNGS